MAHLRLVDVRLDRGGERRGERVLQLAVAAQQRFERRLAHAAVGILQVRAVGAFRQRQGLAARPGNVGKRHVRVGEQSVGLLGGGEHFGAARQQGFLRGGKHVRLVAQHFQQRAAAVLQRRRLHPRADFGFGMRQQFGRDPGALRGQFGVAGADARLAGLVRVVDGILVVAQVGVGMQLLQHAIERGFGLQQPRDGGGGVQLALQGQHRRKQVVQAREIGFPRFRRGVERGQVPGQLRGNFAAGRHGNGFGGVAHAS